MLWNMYTLPSSIGFVSLPHKPLHVACYNITFYLSEMDELYAKRKSLVSEFRSQEKEFQMFQKGLSKKKREDFLRKKEEDYRAKQEQFLKDM